MAARTQYVTGFPALPAIAVDARTYRGWVATQPKPRTLARLLGWELIGAAVVAVLFAVLPLPTDADAGALAALAAVSTAGGVALLSLRRVSEALFLNSITGLVVLVTVALLVAQPLGLAPLLYLWPLILTAYYASPGRLIGNCVLTLFGFAFALVAGADTDAPVQAFFEYSTAMAVVVFALRYLRIRVAALYSQLEEVVSRDHLTGVLNRSAFERAMQAWLGQGIERQHQVALLLVDIDDFDSINGHGHDAGDAALQHLADLIRQSTRETDAVGRVGGNQFGVLLPAAQADSAIDIAERIRSTVGRRAEECGHRFTVSIGVAGSAAFSSPWEGAARALSLAKTAGRDRVVRAETETQVERSDGESSLTVAI